MSSTERLSAALDGRYKIEKQLGQGGMATVYLAKDIKHDRMVGDASSTLASSVMVVRDWISELKRIMARK